MKSQWECSVPYKKYKYALVIGAEKLSSIVDWQDRGTCVLFGDGASAVILERDHALPESEYCLIASELVLRELIRPLYLPAGGSAMPASHDTVEQRQHYIKMNGQETFKLAVNGMVGACRNTMKESGVKSEDVAWVIPHQANLRIIGAVAQRLTIPEERVYVNIDKYGNTSAASIGICLDELCRAGKIKRGDYILLTAFGGGLTWGAMLIRW
ncbi:MAG: 3-oxoacyl-[acyl-carrier-protein] synthase III C-terminal domain-containing protein [Victivallales bacterium]